MTLSKRNNPIQLTFIIAITFFVTLTAVQAQTYQDSQLMKVNSSSGKDMWIVPNKIIVHINKDALDSYLLVNDLTEIVINATLTEELVDGRYQLAFTFEPYGVYFTEPMEVKVKSHYHQTGFDITLSDATGAPLSAQSEVLSTKTIFYMDELGGSSRNGASSVKNYQDSVVMRQEYTAGRTLVLVGQPIRAEIKADSVDAYLVENGLNEVNIVVSLQEQYVASENGDHYRLWFTFEPNGVYFTDPLKLKVGGDYHKRTFEEELLDAMGDPIEATEELFSAKTLFWIDNFNAGTSQPFAASYSASKVFGVSGGTLAINSDARINIPNRALEAYLLEQGITDVEITVEMYYGWDASLLFVFGPSGTYFDPDLELKIEGGYVADDMTLTSESGELLEYTTRNDGQTLIFDIPHFSSYYYDDYDGY